MHGPSRRRAALLPLPIFNPKPNVLSVWPHSSLPRLAPKGVGNRHRCQTLSCQNTVPGRSDFWTRAKNGVHRTFSAPESQSYTRPHLDCERGREMRQLRQSGMPPPGCAASSGTGECGPTFLCSGSAERSSELRSFATATSTSEVSSLVHAFLDETALRFPILPEKCHVRNGRRRALPKKQVFFLFDRQNLELSRSHLGSLRG